MASGDEGIDSPADDDQEQQNKHGGKRRQVLESGGRGHGSSQIQHDHLRWKGRTTGTSGRAVVRYFPVTVNICYTHGYMKHTIRFSLVVLSLFLVGAACQKASPQSSLGGIHIESAEEGAFGSLIDLAQSPQTSAGGGLTDSSTRSSTATTAPAADVKIAPAPESTYTYVFNGTPVSLTESTVNVFERNGRIDMVMPDSLGQQAGLGVMNMSRLSQPSVYNLTLRSDDEIWFVDTVNGMISMYLDTTARVAVADQPTDSTQPTVDTNTVISIANAFLADRGIATTAYGQPTVTSSSGVYAAGTTVDSTTTVTKPEMMISPTAQVLYPLVLNGLPVVQANGEPMGLTVTVETATGTVTAVYGLNSLDFTSSAYPAITDWPTIQKTAEQGGMYRYGVGAPGAKTTTVHLGTPDRVLMVSYRYEENHSRELYVPALRFPLVNPPDAYSKYVVVSIAQDLPADSPIDIIEPAVGSGTAEESTPPSQ